MKVIFLDVDGVLNFSGSEARVTGHKLTLGIAEKCVKYLRKIVEATGAYLILCSSWKRDWDPDFEKCGDYGKYLSKKLNRHGLHIIDKTNDHGDNRGEGIVNWLKRHDNTTSWIVLDDDIFADYEECGIMPHLVHTSFFTGLTEEHVDQAIHLLNGGVDHAGENL